MAKSNKTRYALLGFLSMQDASGYDIKKMMERSTNNFWRESDSSIYPILKQLLEEGMVSCAVGNAESDKPKKVYSITDDGFQEFLDWLNEEPPVEQARNELMLKVFFGWNADKKITISHIKKFQQHVLGVQAKYKLIEKNAPQVEERTNAQIYQYLTLKAGQIYMKARLQWCEEAIELLESRALSQVKRKTRLKKK